MLFGGKKIPGPGKGLKVHLVRNRGGAAVLRTERKANGAGLGDATTVLEGYPLQPR